MIESASAGLTGRRIQGAGGKMSLSDGADLSALEQTYADSRPIDLDIAKEMLREAKQIMDQLKVVFFLRQGTCLGAVRDNELIPWDDDVDLGSVIGLNGLSERSIDRVVAAFRDNGYFAKVESNDHYINAAMIKSSMRLDWACYRIIDDNIFHYPGIRLPIRLFTELKEIDFIGEKFLVPNPPEEYLRIKYGPSWMTPKKQRWEEDVVDPIPEPSLPGRAGNCRLRVLDNADNPVAGADVVVARLSRSKTDKQGYARFYLPCDDWYAVTIRYGNHKELLYEEKMAPGVTYVYRPDPLSDSGRHSVLSRR